MKLPDTILPLPNDSSTTELERHIRDRARVTLSYEIKVGSYIYTFNVEEHCLPENIGYTYIRNRKLSKQDVLRLYGGDQLVNDYLSYLERTAPPKKEYRAGSMRGLLHKKR